MAAGRAPRISVVVPCRGHADVLGRCLEGIARQRIVEPFEVVVVDSEPDPAVEREAGRWSEVVIARATAPLGAGPARNLGVATARGEILAFTDADCVPEEGWLAAAVAALDGAGRPVVVGGSVLDLHPLHPIAVSDNLLQFADFGPRRPAGRATYFPGANVAVRRSAFDEIGGFPESFAGAGEDTLLCDAALARWPDGLAFAPAMRVRHEGRLRLAEYLDHQRRFGLCRGALGLRLAPSHVRWGRRRATLPLVALRRLAYVGWRTATWHPLALPRAACLLPLLVGGLAAWAGGFRRGVVAAGEDGA